MLKVEQGDREAAALLSMATARCGDDEPYIIRCRKGELDNTITVQAFAKHREDTALPLREALKIAILYIEDAAKADGGLDACDISIRSDYDKLHALLHPDTTGGE